MSSEKDVLDNRDKLFESQLGKVKLALSNKKESEAFRLINELVEAGDESNPRFHLAYFYLGLICQKAGSKEDAESAYRKSISLYPEYSVAHNNLAQLLAEKTLFPEAEKHYLLSLELDPANYKTFYNLAQFYFCVDKNQQGLLMLRNSLRIEPEYQPARELLKRVVDIKSSILSLEKSLKKSPNDSDICCDLIVFYEILKNYEASVKYIKKLLEMDRLSSIIFLNYSGLIYCHLNQFLDDGIKVFNDAIRRYPGQYVLYNNLANSLIKKRDWEKALKAVDKAIKLSPSHYILYYNKSIIYWRKTQYKNAMDAALKSIDLNPGYLPSYFMVLNSALFIADWVVVNLIFSKLMEIVNHKLKQDGKLYWLPLIGLMLPIDNQKTTQLVRKTSESFLPKKKYDSYDMDSLNGGKIRVAYISADFTNDHPVGLLTRKIFSLHDRSQFEIFGYALKNYNDKFSTEIKDTFDHYVSLGNRDDKKAAEQIHQDGIHILVDLGGYTEDARHRILSVQPAPIQIQYLGYTGSMQADWIQYYVTCEESVPKSLQQYFTEKLIYMPEGNYSTFPEVIPKNLLKKEDFGLPDQGVIFCCFNNTQRINETVFKVWMNILKEVPRSVLWLNEEGQTMKNNLNRYAEAVGLDHRRIIYCKRQHLSDHWHHQLAHLWLDTFTLPAGTGAILCANVGLPVLTLAGETPQSRVGAAIAVAANAEEMVCHSIEEYQKRAIDFGNHPEKLKMIKEGLIKNRKAMPLFNPDRFICHLEEAYKKIVKNYVDGNEPKTISIQKLPT